MIQKVINETAELIIEDIEIKLKKKVKALPFVLITFSKIFWRK